MADEQNKPMRILDEQGNEIKESDVDTSIGYVTQEQIVKKHHDAVEKQDEVYHYAVETWYFQDGTSMDIKTEDDPHVKILDAKTGVFEYVDQGEGKEYKGATLRRVVDQEAKDEKAAYDEYEDIRRYHLYTEEQLEAQKQQREAAKKEQELQIRIRETPDRLDTVEKTTETNTNGISTNSSSIEDLTVMMSELVGSEE